MSLSDVHDIVLNAHHIKTKTGKLKCVR